MSLLSNLDVKASSFFYFWSKRFLFPDKTCNVPGNERASERDRERAASKREKTRPLCSNNDLAPEKESHCFRRRGKALIPSDVSILFPLTSALHAFQQKGATTGDPKLLSPSTGPLLFPLLLLLLSLRSFPAVQLLSHSVSLLFHFDQISPVILSLPVPQAGGSRISSFATSHAHSVNSLTRSHLTQTAVWDESWFYN